MQKQAKKIIILFFVIALTAAAYSSCLDNGFTNLDDPSHLLGNSLVRSLDKENILEIFKQQVNRTYIPLTTLSYALEYHFFRYEPFIYHWDNLFLHLFVVAMVYVFALRLGFSCFSAGISALFFGIHPMHVESVAWVTERKDVLYSCFYMLSLIFYFRYVQEEKKGLFGLTFLFGLLSILAKPMALSLPLILFACDWFLKRRLTIKTVVEKGILALAIVPMAFITYINNSLVVTASSDHLKAILIFSWKTAFYIQKFIWPVHLSPRYLFPEPVSFANLNYLFSFCFVLIFLLIIWKLRKNRLFIFSFLFFFASIFFLLQGTDHYADMPPVADRFMYLPSLGFCLLFGKLVEEGMKKSKHKKLVKFSCTMLGVLLIISLCWKTFFQCNVWQNSVSLWTKIIEQDPGNAQAYSARGVAYAKEGLYAASLKDSSYAAKLRPDRYKAYANRGYVFLNTGKYVEALNDYNRAVNILNVLMRKDMVEFEEYRRKNQVKKALYYYRHFRYKKKDLAHAYYNRAVVYDYRGEYKKALGDALRAKDFGKTNLDGYIKELRELIKD